MRYIKFQRYSILFLLLTNSLNVFSQQTISNTIKWKSDKGNILKAYECESCVNNGIFDKTAYAQSIESPWTRITAVHLKNVIVQETAEIDATNPEFDVSFSQGWAGNKQILHYKVATFRRNPLTQKVERLMSFELSLLGNNENKPSAAAKGLRSATASALASNDWYKIAVIDAGVYKLDYDFITKTMKIDAAKFNLSTCGVFGYSNGSLPTLNAADRYDDMPQNTIKIYDFNKNDRLDAGDFILFYAAGNTKWEFNQLNKLFSHVNHIYSEKSYYFFTPNGGTGKRIVENNTALIPDKTIATYLDHIVYEKELENPLKSGRVWLGDVFSPPKTTKVFPISVPNIASAIPVNVFSSFAASSKSSNSSVELSINGQSVLSHFIGSTTEAYQLNNASGQMSNPSDNLQISYSFNNVSAESKGNLNYVELNVNRKFIFTGEQLSFRSAEELGNNKNLAVNFQTTGNFEIWNVTDIAQMYQIKTTETSPGMHNFVFNNNMMQEMVIFDPGRTRKPEFAEKIDNQNIHGLSQADYFIITAKTFLPAANKLAAFHKERDNMKVHVLDVQKIYNEFSSGTKDLTAIRDMLKMFYDRAAGVQALKPKSVLLLGDASYDYKGIISQNDIIPTYESVNSWESNDSYNTDDYIAYMDHTEGGDDIIAVDNFEDLGVGRIPCNTLEQANGVVNKIINYKNGPASFRDWRNYITLVADDVDESYDFAFQQQSDDFIAKVVQNNFQKFNLEKIYLDAYKQESSAGGSRYPDANKILLDRINFGSLAISYIGHGGPTNWAQERLFGNTEIAGLKNFNALPFFITATCDFSPFDNPTSNSAGENLVLNPNGGAVSIISTTRTVFISNNGTLVQNFFSEFFTQKDGKYLNLGEITRLAKVKQAKDNNARKFVLLGDPALTLNYPELNAITTEINGQSSFSNDTLKALQKVTIKGEIRDANNNLVTGFNGICYPTIFDKAEIQKTLKNDPAAADFSFLLQRNIVFKGKCTVTGGKFEYSFIVPKDINYSIGNGKISYYAENASSGGKQDAGGYNANFLIGGSDLSAASDNAGPQVNLFMNSENFSFGGTTDENPVLLAKLFDESGINTVGSGIGHDITAVLDENTKNAVVLNNFYESDVNDFTKGKVNYNFYKLSEGLHTLKVKAWDVYNNPGEGVTEFIVAKSTQLVLKQLLNYPNPFTTNTCFQFEHNKAGEPLDVIIQVFTVSGKMVKEFNQRVITDGYRIDKELCWDGLDVSGDAMGRGIYVYKVIIKDSLGNTASGVQKLVILK